MSQGEAQRERESQVGSTPSMEPVVGLDPTTLGSPTEPPRHAMENNLTTPHCLVFTQLPLQVGERTWAFEGLRM